MGCKNFRLALVPRHRLKCRNYQGHVTGKTIPGWLTFLPMCEIKLVFGAVCSLPHPTDVGYDVEVCVVYVSVVVQCTAVHGIIHIA